MSYLAKPSSHKFRPKAMSKQNITCLLLKNIYQFIQYKVCHDFNKYVKAYLYLQKVRHNVKSIS